MGMNQLLTAAIIVLVAIGCQQPDPYFEYTSLKKIHYDTAHIKDGADIEILSFSGGPECSPGKTYYYQFIGIIKETSDTVRVLTPCQVLPEGSIPSEGSFSSMSVISDVMDKDLQANGVESFKKGDQVVVFNKSHLDLEKRPFKTALGSLSFK